jgi:hypothetical protein
MRLIVSADDFGYFPEVSAGIGDCIVAGTVTATAVLANAPDFTAAARQLRALPQADWGVHLNLTTGRPLSTTMQDALHGRPFPGLGRMALNLLRPAWRAAALEEFAAQIEHCERAGLKPVFLNSHQHIHMLPALYQPLRALARARGITHLRHTRPDGLWRGLRPWLRERLFALGAAARAAVPGTPWFIGLAASGRLTLDFLRARLARMPPDAVCELMCHPGRSISSSAPPAALAAYHDWAGERALLLSPGFRQLLESLNITLVRYRDL